MLNTKINKWYDDHMPVDNANGAEKYKEIYHKFLTEKIFPMFTEANYESTGYDWLIRIEQELDRNVDVVGTFEEDGLVHPVFCIRYRDALIVFRYNLHNFEIMIDSKYPVNLPRFGLFESREYGYDYQGFPEEYRIRTSYFKNQRRFMAKAQDEYAFYAMMFLLRAGIFKNSKYPPTTEPRVPKHGSEKKKDTASEADSAKETEAPTEVAVVSAVEDTAADNTSSASDSSAAADAHAEPEAEADEPVEIALD